MKRRIITIDEEKCNGCGFCIPNCPEGALQIIDGKARLISDLCCDGLGACLGECPQGAISQIEREAEPYDERRVMENIVRQGPNVVAAHLRHLKSHGEMRLFEEAVAFLKETGHAVLSMEDAPALHRGGCPGSIARTLNPPSQSAAPASGGSALRQWPVQLKLLNPDAAYFDDAELLVAADCTAFAHGAFHRDLLNGKILIAFCPKLDSNLEEYVAKLSEIFRRHNIRSITVARMTVPCCGGTTAIVERAIQLSGREIPVTVRVIDLDGTFA